VPAATLTDKGQVVIPAEIRVRYELTPGTQVEFVDDGGAIRLVIRRKVAPSDPKAGFGMVKATRKSGGASASLLDFDPASMVEGRRGRR
jgi:AbrB family looped-hinge helix DNA binding protein